MQPSPEQTPGLVPSLKKLLHSVLAMAGNRAELLAVEVQEEAERWLGAFLLAAVLAALGTLTLTLITLTVVMACGEEHRVAGMAGLSVVYLLTTVGVAARLRWRLQNWPSFSATVGELKKDKAWLEEKK